MCVVMQRTRRRWHVQRSRGRGCPCCPSNPSGAPLLPTASLMVRIEHRAACKCSHAWLACTPLYGSKLPATYACSNFHDTVMCRWQIGSGRIYDDCVIFYLMYAMVHGLSLWQHLKKENVLLQPHLSPVLRPGASKLLCYWVQFWNLMPSALIWPSYITQRRLHIVGQSHSFPHCQCWET